MTFIRGTLGKPGPGPLAGAGMYRAFFGLRERPFDLTANPRFLYFSKGHREALSLLHYGIAGDKGITLLLGEAGTGKTTILRAACQQQSEPAVHAMHLADPVISRQELHEFIAYELRLPSSVASSKVAFLRGLHQALHERRTTGRHIALVDRRRRRPSRTICSRSSGCSRTSSRRPASCCRSS